MIRRESAPKHDVSRHT